MSLRNKNALLSILVAILLTMFIVSLVENDNLRQQDPQPTYPPKIQDTESLMFEFYKLSSRRYGVDFEQLVVHRDGTITIKLRDSQEHYPNAVKLMEKLR